MRILFSGVWARRGLNGASLLVSVLALTAAMLGPMYSRASSEHLLDQRLSQRAPYTVGLTDSEVSVPPVSRNAGGPAVVHPKPSQQLLADTRAALTTPSINRYWAAPVPWLHDQGGLLVWKTHEFTAPLYWRAGMCRFARITGSCPTQPGQVLLQTTMAKTMGLGVGGHLSLTYETRTFRLKKAPFGGGKVVVEVLHKVPRTFTVVGTYTIDDPTSPAWFDLSRFTGVDNLKPVPPSLGGPPLGPPLTPALLVAPATMTSEDVVGGNDRPIDLAKVGIDSMAAANRTATSFVTKTINASGNNPSPDLDLHSVFAQVRSEHTLLSRVMLAALAPLVVLVLLLLYGMVSTAAEQRRPHVALAKLRGHSRWRVFRFAVAEPFLAVAVAVPVAVALAVVAARLIARTRLGGVSVPIERNAWVALVVVAAAALLAATSAALSVIQEPLSSSLSGSVRASGASRWGTVLRTAAVAVAFAAVAQLLVSKHQGAQLLALLAPMFVALAVAVFAMVLLRMASRLLVRRTAGRGSTPLYLASRRLARRGDLLNLMVPMLLAVSMIGFSLSAAHSSNSWRDSRARAEIGADRTFDTDATAGRLMRVTHQVDPHGKWVMAAVLDNSGNGLGRHILVDATRFANVMAWDPSWSTLTASRLQQRLEPHAQRLAFTGRRITATVTAGALRSHTRSKTQMWLKYVNDDGETRDQAIGFVKAHATRVLHTELFDCTKRCLVSQLFFSDEGQSVSDVNGSFTIHSIAIDGRTVDWGLTRIGAWRPAQPFPVSLIDPPLTLTPSAHGMLVRLFLGNLPPGPGQVTPIAGIARMTPTSTPAVVPVLATRGTPVTSIVRAGSGTALSYPLSTVQGTSLNGGYLPVRIVNRVTALPQLGDQGELADLSTELVEYAPPAGLVLVTQLWAKAGTPPSVFNAIRAAGVNLTPFDSLAARSSTLKNDAFSRGLQVFLGIGLVALLLAIFGVFASAVMSARWRGYEVASLRVVGVSQRALVRASVLEYLGLLGMAVVMGVVSALISLALVLPAIGLGPRSAYDPKPAYGVEWGLVLGSGVGVLLVAVLVALLVSRRITRLGRPSTLRWAEQG
ncbi:MAG: FtsX-like permease family protein [Nocardioidaceae bacterium]